MYIGTLFVYMIIFVLLSPVIWIGWWLIADLGEKVSGATAVTHETWTEPKRRVA